MKRLSITLLTSLLIYLLSAGARLGYAEEVRGVTDDTIKVGVIADLTGPTSNVGVMMIEAYKIFSRYINEKGGMHGRKIKLIIEDDRYSIPAGIAAFKKLVFKDQVFAIMGPVSVGETKVLSRHIKKNKIPTLPYAPDKSARNPYKKYLFPVNGFYDNEWGVILHYILKELKHSNPKIAFATVDVESGKVVKASADRWAKFYGLKIHHETIPLAAIDVSSQVLTMKRKGINIIVVHHVAPGAAAVLKSLRKFDFNVPVFGLSSCCSEDVIRISGNASKNFRGASPYGSWYDDSPGMKKVREITLKYNPDAEKSYSHKGFTWGWAIHLILQEGLKKAGKDLNVEKLVSALEAVKDLETEGIIGPITFTSSMHYGLNYNKIFRADTETCRFIPITDWRLPPSRE